jgi:hypothetical protein
VPNVAGWVYGLVATAFTAALVGWLTGFFNKAPHWIRQAVGMLRRFFRPATQEPPTNFGFMEGAAAIAQQVDIDLRGDAAVTFQLNTQIPQLFLWFEVANRSPVDLQLDRMLLDVSINAPLLSRGAILDRRPVPRGTRVSNVYFSTMLTTSQVGEIRRLMTVQGNLEGMQIGVTAYFQAREGWVEVSKHVTRSKVAVG